MPSLLRQRIERRANPRSPYDFGTRNDPARPKGQGSRPPAGQGQPRGQERRPHPSGRPARRAGSRAAHRQRAGSGRGPRPGPGRPPHGPPDPASRRTGRHARRLPACGRSARPRRRHGQPVAAPQRPAGGPHARTAGRHRHDLRGPPQRDHRRGHPLPEGGQCRDPARRQRGPALQHRSGRPAAPGPGRSPPMRPSW